MSPAAKSAWVIGGSGFLGSVILELCHSAGWRTLTIDPACSGAAQHELCGHGGNISILRAAFSRLAPQVVFFCSATRGGDVSAYRRAYWEPVVACAEIAPQARLVFCSSSAVYTSSGEVTEESCISGETLLSTGSERHRVLMEAEAAVLAAGGVVGRLSALYGPGRCELLRQHLAGESQLPGGPDRVLNYVHVQDAARALLLLGEAEFLPHRVYNICAESFTKAQAYSMLEELTGKTMTPTVAPIGRRGMSDHRVSSARLRSELGWRPLISWRDFVCSHTSA